MVGGGVDVVITGGVEGGGVVTDGSSVGVSSGHKKSDIIAMSVFLKCIYSV